MKFYFYYVVVLRVKGLESEIYEPFNSTHDLSYASHRCEE